ncbi:Putative fatty-acid--CoA ligase FadD21 [Seminavis robusta]|uniref:Fatty-acid--CoA ligase FadD21 n=1 Tax=Seminavis robusta TaxID=568900 RepID=A0A9N8ELF7_9STRA|nr:Putative fatty-acid--CoA ligase FadD21 [Seminavis robusta]|eukprot:Sro1309_g261520.1 Putative fatty-acid--CoA ligase FadD21 (1421) ;mRNA; f:16324-21100
MATCSKLVANERYFPAQTTKHFLETTHEVVQRKKDTLFSSWYNDKGILTDTRTFAEVWDRAGIIAYQLKEKWNIPKGGKVVLCYDFGLHFFEVFLGCLRAGVTAVLVYPPAPPLSKSLDKLVRVIDDCNPALILTDTRINRCRQLDMSNMFSKTRQLWPSSIEFKVTDRLQHTKMDASLTSNFDLPAQTDIAFMQYTSGSTGMPKAVMVSYQNLSHQVSLIHYHCDMAFWPDWEERIGFSWLPQYHDMGLLMKNLAPYAAGSRMHMMSPISFIRNPVRWVELMSKHKVHWCMAPDFSFRLVARKYREHKNPPALDLSGLSGLGSAAEPVQPDTKAMFESVFQEHGLPEDWYGSAYGMAEHVAAITSRRGYVLSKPRPEDNGKQYVSNGIVSTHEKHVSLKIVDPSTCQEVDDGSTGEVWVASDGVVVGYFGKEELSKETFHAQLKGANPSVTYLRTGDLGFLQDGNFFVCGRIKDLLIINGANYYPQDIEFVTQAASKEVKPGCVAAFATSEMSDESSLEVVFEVRSDAATNAETVCAAVRDAIVQRIGLVPSKVVAISQKIPKTTSGKIQRRATRTALHKGGLEILHCLESGKSQPSTANKTQDTPGPPQGVTSMTDEEYHQAIGSVFASTLGHGVDETMSWEDLGLSSMAAVELQNLCSEQLLCTLPPTFQDIYPTPTALRSHLIESRGHISFPSLPSSSSSKDKPLSDLSWYTQAILQGLGIVVLLLTISFTFVPAYQVGKALSSTDELNETLDQGTRWQWLPLVVPFWMLSFSATVILCKWLVIGRYQEIDIAIPSTYYARWWFVDRLVHTWETWIGSFLKDTPLLWLFYVLLGAKIHPSVQVKAFVREFDLVGVGAHSSIEHDINCRRFRPWLSEGELYLSFRPISIGNSCKVQGLVGLGSKLGNHCVVERLAAIAEGSQVPDNTLVEGSPAYGSPLPSKDNDKPLRSNQKLCLAAFLKIAWQMLELYFFAASIFFCTWILAGRLPTDFRYTPLLFWILVLLLQTLLSMACTVFLKWALIGKVQPGPVQSTLMLEMRDWFVDYRYMVTLHIVATVWSNSKITNLYLKALGMDLDWKSHVFASYFCPSQVDLITVKNSFISAASFQPAQDGRLDRIEVVNSSLGRGAVLKGGVKVDSTRTLPHSVVTGDMMGTECHSLMSTATAVATEVCYIVMLGAVFVSAIPAYEVFTASIWGSGVGLGFSVVKFALAMLVQTLTWLVMYWALQHVLFITDGKIESSSLYAIYLTISYNFMWVTSLLHLACGTPFINECIRFMGAKVEGRLIFFADELYDAPHVTFSDKVVVDRCAVTAHSVVFDKLVVGPVHVAGIVHQGTLLVARTDMTGQVETGPNRFFVSKGTVRHERGYPTSLEISDGDTVLEMRKQAAADHPIFDTVLKPSDEILPSDLPHIDTVFEV